VGVGVKVGAGIMKVAGTQQVCRIL